MRKYRLLALTLVFAMMFSTVMGCGNNKDTADADATNEETVIEDESTEATAAEEKSYLYSGSDNICITYSDYPISEETKKMLIDKFTGLTLEKGQEFDMNSLSFKENEQDAYNLIYGKMIYMLYTDNNENGIIKCNLESVRVNEIDSKDTSLTIWFERGNTTEFGNHCDDETASIDYSKEPISDETKEMLINNLIGLLLKKGQKFDVYALPFKDNERQACYLLESTLAYHMFSPINGTGVLECCKGDLLVYNVKDEGDCLRIFMWFY